MKVQEYKKCPVCGYTDLKVTINRINKVSKQYQCKKCGWMFS